MSGSADTEMQRRRRALCSPESLSSEFSDIATIISFIMAIFVISIHANNLKYYSMEDATCSSVYQEVKIIAEIIGGMAVPFFFMLSG